MSYYRETFGHREGEFPVCEDVAARSIALPFFPADDRGPGRRSRAALARAGAARTALGCPDNRRSMSRFAEPQHAAFRALNDSLVVRLAARAVRRPAVARARLDARRARDHQRGGPRPAARPRSTRSSASCADGTFPFAERRRGHPHGDRAARHRARRPGRGEAPHRPLAQRPGGDRRGDVRPRPCVAVRPQRLERGADADRRRRARTSTGRCPATRISSAPSRST